MVYSFDGELQRPFTVPPAPWKLRADLVKQQVDGVIPQGQADICELRTPTRSIRGTAAHPLLVVRRETRASAREHTY